MISPPASSNFAGHDQFDAHEIREESEAEWDAHFYHRVMGYQQLLAGARIIWILGRPQRWHVHRCRLWQRRGRC